MIAVIFAQGDISKLEEVRGNKILLHKNTFNESFMKDKLLNDPYTTIRNSSTVWQSWRKALTNASVRYVQRICSSVMRRLNYLPITSSSEMTDMNHAVIRNWCHDDVLPTCLHFQNIGM